MKTTRRPYILIREFKRGDDIPRRELMKNYVMSFAFDAFLSCLFREVSPANLPNQANRPYLWIPFFPNQIDLHSIDCLGSGCDVHILRSAIADLLVGDSVCDRFPLRVGIFHVFQQRHGVGERKFLC